MSEQEKRSLAAYISEYLTEEAERGNAEVDYWMVLEAIDAYLGGANNA